MANTNIVLALSLEDKKTVMTGLPGLYENVIVTLVGSGSYTAANLVLGIINDGVLCATIPQGGFTGVGPSGISGSLNLNTQELINVFSPDIGRTMRKFTVAIWDLSRSSLVTNDVIFIVNNPYNSSMAPPTPVPPIGGGSINYVALSDYLAHVHQTGDGGSLDPYYMRRSQNGAFFRQSADNLDIELRVRIDGKWRTLISYNGLLTLGDPTA